MTRNLTRSTAAISAVCLILNTLLAITLTAPPADATTGSAGTAHCTSNGLSIAINDALPQPPIDERRTEPGNGNDNAHEALPASEHVATAGHSWSLPITGPLTLVKKTTRRLVHKRKVKDTQAAQQKFTGSISFSDPYDQIFTHTEVLLETAMKLNPDTEVIERAVQHYRKPIQRVIAEGKDATAYVIPYRGFGPSSEAGDIILDEKLKLKSKAAAEYARQKHVDKLHLQVVSGMMQLAMGMGMSDRVRGEQITTSGFDSLKELVGEEQATQTMAMLSAMAKNLEVPGHVYEQPTWDVHQAQAKHRKILELSLEDDLVVRQIKKHVHKYNRRSKFARASSKIVQTVLGAASLTPNFIGPAAKTALVAFVMATGGPEQAKLLKELYLDKRFDSRWKVLNEESHMALHNYQLALLTKNPVLLVYSESLVGQMIGEHSVKDVFGTSLLASKTANTKTM